MAPHVPFEVARNIATVAASLIALIGVYPLVMNLIANQRSLRAKVFFDSFNLLEGQNGELRDLREKLRSEIKKDTDQHLKFDILVKPDTLQKELDKLGRSYDKIGLLVKHSVVPVSFLFDFYSDPIIKAWQYLSPYYIKIRNDRNQYGHMLKFEILATGAALYRMKKKKETPPFEITPENKRMWNKWRKWYSVPRHRRYIE
jgi:hypothetical protein